MLKRSNYLNKELQRRGFASSRSQADDIITRRLVSVGGKLIDTPNAMIDTNVSIAVLRDHQFVSRAGEKLYGAIKPLGLNFKNKIILDVGSSTGGFTQVSLIEGAKHVVAVEKGTDQMHSALRSSTSLTLYEKTDINKLAKLPYLDLVLIDVSFTSLRPVLLHLAKLIDKSAVIVALVKPQFESASSAQHKGIIKNEHIRRNTLKDFEQWVKQKFIIEAKVDSKVVGAKGNTERFYRLKKLKSTG